MDFIGRLAHAAARDPEPRMRAEPADRTNPLSRRALLLGGGWLAGAAAPALAGGATRSAVSVLLDRTTYGPTLAERELAAQLGPAAYLEYQLNPAAISDAELDARLAPLTSLTLPPYLISELPPNQPLVEFWEATFLRAILTRRQLFERMVEFWHEHFYVSVLANSILKIVADREVVRPRALGRFRDLLHGMARSPAMLDFLDNDLNHRDAPNENFARELLELHTIGVDSGYTQTDIREVARCFTGWSYYNAGAQPPESRFTFVFRPDYHDWGQKIVLGHVIPWNGGIDDGYRVLDILAAHPATAARISAKLCAWFWGEDPPQTMVARVTQVFLDTDGDIRAMIRSIVNDHGLSAAPLKFKRPFHLFMSALRQTGGHVLGTGTLRVRLAQAGHLPFTWVPPDGFPDTLDFWSRLLLPRWNFALNYCINQVGGLAFDPLAFLDGAATPTAAIDRINGVLFGGQLPAAEKQILLTFAETGYFGFDDMRKRETVGMALGSPAYQWY